jgi:tetratricopeptide (TPR) repeat protein
MHMVIRQFFVPAARPRQAPWLGCIFSALALFLAGCSDRTTEAYAEAQTAQALLQQGDLRGARLAIGRALALREDQVDILLLDGQIKTAMGDLRAAYDSYRMVLALDPRRPEALLAVAQFGIALGETREALEAADQVLTIVPDQPDALLVKGIHALNQKDYAEAIALGDRMLAANPGDRKGIVLKARGLSLTGRRDEALALLRKASEEFGNDQLIATAMLENARDTGEVDIMLEQIGLLRQIRPDSVDLAIDEVNIRYKSGNVEGARTISGEILERMGGDAEAMRRLARLWREYDPDPLGPLQVRALSSDGATNARQVAARHYLAQGAHRIAA